ncbi:adhesion G protein-coupled receptor F4 [Heteronotia binoei]|uniref:adhesion G protein-coupled receptor F4 n=1 Tax=Heteronotia binoei TaxID=13085 RepID=UPI00292F375E|nr:adhesion G protein-coupled receptor F4 [Heteronotia binoei]
MIAQQIIRHSLVIFCAAWISLGEPQIKGKVSNPRHLQANRSPSEECVGDCSISGKDCTKLCKQPFNGTMTFVCLRGQWEESTETCTRLNIQSLLQRISRPGPDVNTFSTLGGRDGQFCPADFSCITNSVLKEEPKAGDIVGVVTLLKTISSNFSTNVTTAKLKSYSKMANHILKGSILPEWAFVSDKNASSTLMKSVVSFARNLKIRNSPLDVSDPFIETKGAKIDKNTPEKTFTLSFGFNDSKSRLKGAVSLLREELQLLPADSQIITVAMPTLGPILEKTLPGSISLNGMVLSVALPKALEKVSLTFEKMNKTANVVCVAWRSAYQIWDKTACELEKESSATATATCRCQYQPDQLQSFSILMSSVNVNHPALHYITHVGLAVSICSLLLCLAIEAAVWRQVTQTHLSYMRHVCLVNIAVSLLIADILFIVVHIMTDLPKKHEGCVTATFFVHFFYLALFFWMLALGLLILYGLLAIFWHLRKSALLALAFCIGYGCPTVIALLTVMITEPRKVYLRDNTCWLNWNESRALLAFIIPAFLIIGVNLVVVFVVLAKSGRSSVGNRSNTQDLVTVIRVGKNLVLLTPLLGLTWVFGLLIVHNDRLDFHIVFSLLNSFQGGFILLFGTLLDRKTREVLWMKCFPSKTPPSDAKL